MNHPSSMFFLVLVSSVLIPLTFLLCLDTRVVQKTPSYWKPSLFLVQYANQTTVPSSKELSDLTRAGLGTLYGYF